MWVTQTLHPPRSAWWFLLCRWKFFLNSACSHRLLWCLMTSNNEAVSCQNLWAGNNAKSMMSEGNSAMLPVNVDCLGDLFSYICTQKRFFVLHGPYKKSLKDWSLGKQLSLFPSHLNVSLSSISGNKINAFPRNQSLNVYYMFLGNCPHTLP